MHRFTSMRPSTLLLAALILSGVLSAACDSRRFPTIATTSIAVSDTTTRNPSQPIQLLPAQANMRMGDTLRFVATGGVSGATLSWGTTASGTIVVQSVAGTTALVGAVGTGTASVFVSVVGDPTRSAASVVSVTP